MLVIGALAAYIAIGLIWDHVTESRREEAKNAE